MRLTLSRIERTFPLLFSRTFIAFHTHACAHLRTLDTFDLSLFLYYLKHDDKTGTSVAKIRAIYVWNELRKKKILLSGGKDICRLGPAVNHVKPFTKEDRFTWKHRAQVNFWHKKASSTFCR